MDHMDLLVLADLGEALDGNHKDQLASLDSYTLLKEEPIVVEEDIFEPSSDYKACSFLVNPFEALVEVASYQDVAI
jgi:hypothetical protein